MPPLYVSIIGSIVRLLLAPLVVWLNAHGITITDDQTTQIVIDASAIVVAIVWAIWKNVQQHRIINTAAGAGEPLTTAEVKQSVDNGVFASARTPANQVPEVRANS